MPWPRLQPERPWTDRPMDERARAIEAACRAAMQILASLPDRQARLERIDPVPASTHALLRRLAAQAPGNSTAAWGGRAGGRKRKRAGTL